jgi:thioredoxin 1
MREEKKRPEMVADEELELERIKERKIREMEEEIKARDEERTGGKDIIDHPLTITDSIFIETIRKYPLVVIDCWAPWCGPCRMVAPAIEELAKEYAGKVVFGKLNVDENPQIASDFGIMAIPTLFIFKNGDPVDVIQGALPKPHLEARVKAWL